MNITEALSKTVICKGCDTEYEFIHADVDEDKGIINSFNIMPCPCCEKYEVSPYLLIDVLMDEQRGVVQCESVGNKDS